MMEGSQTLQLDEDYIQQKKKKTGQRLIGIYLVLYFLFLSCTHKLRTTPTRL